MSQSFEQALLNHGIDFPRIPIGSHKVARWGNNAIFWAVQVGDGYAYGDHRVGETWYWFPKQEESLSIEEIIARREARKIAAKLAAEAKEAYQQEVAANVAEWIGTLSKGRTPYLDKKKIDGDQYLLDGKDLIIPLSDNDGIWSYQRIAPDGSKLMAKGGRAGGCWYRFDGDNSQIYICEGFATAWTVHKATNCTTYAAMSAANIPKVVYSLIELQPNLYICADNDESGTGEKHAKSTGCKYFMPPKELGKDFNDIGVEETKKILCFQSNESLPLIIYPTCHGLVGEITDWIMETARMPQYPLALGAALAFVGALKGHRVQTETGLRTNLFILSVAPSGAGKDHPRKCIEILARDSGLSSLIGGEPASGSGLVDGLYNAGGRQLIQLDEIGRFLKGITNPNAQGFYTEIGTNWMKLFSSASSMYYGKSYANNGNKKIEPRNIDNPCLCINGSTTATRLYEAMTGADVIDGFLNRWLTIECTKEVEAIKGNGRVDDAPDYLVQQVKSIQEWPTQDGRGGINLRIQPKVVPFNVGGYQLLEEYEEQFNALRKATNDPEGLGLLWARASEHMKKVALVVGGYDCIKDQDVEFAFQLVKQCVNLIIEAVQTHVASSDFERKKKRILAIIKGKGGVASLAVIANNSHLSSREYREVITTLLESKVIEEIPGRKTIYRLV